MKTTFNEFKGCFSIDFEAETVADAAFIARLKLNGIKELRGIHANAYKDGTVFGSVIIGKRKQQITGI